MSSGLSQLENQIQKAKILFSLRFSETISNNNPIQYLYTQNSVHYQRLDSIQNFYQQIVWVFFSLGDKFLF